MFFREICLRKKTKTGKSAKVRYLTATKYTFWTYGGPAHDCIGLADEQCGLTVSTNGKDVPLGNDMPVAMITNDVYKELLTSAVSSALCDVSGEAKYTKVTKGRKARERGSTGSFKTQICRKGGDAAAAANWNYRQLGAISATMMMVMPPVAVFVDANVKDCFAWTCSGHGTCTSGSKAFTCKCDQGWSGTRCETSVDDCASNMCASNVEWKQLATLLGHTGTVNSIAWNTDSTRLASGSSDKAIIMWDAVDWKQLVKLTGHTDDVRSIAWNTDSTRLASGSSDRSIIVWDPVEWKQLTTLMGHTSTVNSIAWNTDSTRLASGSSDKAIIMWDAVDWKQLTKLQGHKGTVNSVTWNADSTRLVSASDDNSIKIWDTSPMCPANTYNPFDVHRETTCAEQPPCNPGFRFVKMSVDSKETKRTCSSCPSNTYQAFPWHRKASCIAQPTCGAGQFISTTSKTELQTCTTCPQYTYQDQTNHRVTECKEQTKCDPGFKISANSTTAQQSCTPCKNNTFTPSTNHREELCLQHVKCTVGEAITADDPKRQRECEPCSDNSYQNSTSHRKTKCTTQPGCPRGYAYYAGNKTSERLCEPCASGKFMSLSDHQKECKEQKTCNPGFKISAASTIVAQSCTPCENNTFIDVIGHRENNCTPHAPCGPGTYYVLDATRQRECEPCSDNSYQNSTSHRKTKCTTQPFCGAGEMYTAPANNSAEAVCHLCTNGTYQNKQQHRESLCINHQSCTGSSTGNATHAGTCIAVASSANGNGIIIGAAAGGSILFMGIFIFVTVLVRRCIRQRAAAKRAKVALETAREAFGISRDNQGTVPPIEGCALSSVTVTTVSNATFVLNLADGDDMNGQGDSSTDDLPSPTTQPMSAATIKRSKFVAPTICLGESTLATKGLDVLLGVDPKTYMHVKNKVKVMLKEFAKNGTEEDIQNINTLLQGTYVNPVQEAGIQLL
eukprot:gene1247-11025_t